MSARAACDERAVAVCTVTMRPCSRGSAVAPADGVIGHAVLGREVPFGRQPGAWDQLPTADSCCEAVGDLNVDQGWPARVDPRRVLVHDLRLCPADLRIRQQSYVEHS